MMDLAPGILAIPIIIVGVLIIGYLIGEVIDWVNQRLNH